MKTKMICKIVILGIFFLVGVVGMAQAGDRRYGNRGRQPNYEVHTTDRWVESTRAGGRGNDGVIHFKSRYEVKRKYDRDARRSGKAKRCVDEKGRRVNCR